MSFQKICLNCKKEFLKPNRYSYKQWNTTLYCSRRCVFLCGYYKKKQREISLKNGNRPPARFKNTYGKSIKERKKISKALIGIVRSEATKRKISQTILSKNGRTEPLKTDERNDGAYRQWVKKIKHRDDNVCRIKSGDCQGYNIVHHIIPWREKVALRYELKNGITLCQFHHPRKRVDEIKLIPIFTGLVNTKELI